MSSKSPAFQKAIDDSRNLKSKPTDDDLLEIYALFKIGTGEDFAAAEKPGMFDLKGKAKYNAWKNKVESESLSVNQAQSKYVAKVGEMKTTYGF